MVEDSINCVDIDPEIAIRDYWCVSYQPNDPICDPYRQPTCVNTVEYRTEMCPQYYEGSISQSRTYSCSTQSWSDWFNSGGACVPLPASCVSSTATQTIACDTGYNGEIVQTGEYICETPYSNPLFTGWTTQSNTCVQQVLDINDPVSVVSPISTNVTSAQVDSATVQTNVSVPSTNPIQNSLQEESQQLEQSVNNPIDEVKEDVEDKSDSKKDVKEEKKDGDKKESKDDVDDVENSVHDVLPGFGVVLSPLTLTQNINMFQPQIPQPFSIEQELSDEFKRLDANIIDFIKQDDSEDYYNRSTDSAWDRILRNQFLY